MTRVFIEDHLGHPLEDSNPRSFNFGACNVSMRRTAPLRCHALALHGRHISIAISIILLCVFVCSPLFARAPRVRSKGGPNMGNNYLTRRSMFNSTPVPHDDTLNAYQSVKRLHETAIAILLAPFRVPPVLTSLQNVLLHNTDADLIFFHSGEWTQGL
jgi:hypothetical protein